MKLVDLPDYGAAPDDADLFEVVDTSDTTDDPTGTSVKATAAQLKGAVLSRHITFSVTDPTPQPSQLGGIHVVSGVSVGVAANTAEVAPCGVHRPVLLTEVAVRVSTAASGQARIGLYTADDVNLELENLVEDFGLVDTSTTGVKAITVSTLLDPGVYYWVLAADNPSALFFNHNYYFPGLPTGIPSGLGAYRITATTGTDHVANPFPSTGSSWSYLETTSGTVAGRQSFMRVIWEEA